MDPLIVGTAIFLVSYGLIASDKIPKSAVALGGAVLMILLRVLPQDRAFEYVDFNVIFLLVGMMVIASVMRKTGIFQWVAIKTVKLAGGEPLLILILLSLVTAVASAFLDNVTTVILIAPVTIFVSSRLGISPVPLLIAEIMASNIGGTATLIGDPPNILIGSAAGLDFNAFLLHLGPIAAINLVVFLPTAYFLFRRDLQMNPRKNAILSEMDEGEAIEDRGLLVKTLLVMGITILGFLLHGSLGYKPATIALGGAVLLMIWGKQDPREIWQEIEWPTLFFFIGLFILVGGIVEGGLIDRIARGALALTGSNLVLSTFIMLWLSALLSGIIDNIPYTVAMIPVVQQMGESMNPLPLWWALALGACLGGNLTLIGASANVVVAHIAERNGHPISFRQFLKLGSLVTFESMVVSTLYLWIRYLR